MRRMLDIAYPPALEQLLADMDALGADVVGLYVVNWSAGNAVPSTAYVQAVVARGKRVLPIITPGDAPRDPAQVNTALIGWGVPAGTAIVFDIERYSLPPVTWMDAVDAATARWDPGEYSNASTRLQYQGHGQRWWWEARWTFVETAPPAGDAAIQWTDQAVGPSGTRYDMSDVDDSLRFWGDLEEPEMKHLIVAYGSGQYIVSADLRWAVPLPDSQDLQALMATGNYVACTLDAALMQQILAAMNPLPPIAGTLPVTGSIKLGS